MNTKTLISGIVAGIVAFFAGFLIYGIIMDNYFTSAMPTYPGLMKDPGDIWAIGVGSVIWGILLAWLLNSAGVVTAARGATYAAIAFFLYALGSCFIVFGQMNMFPIEGIFIDALCSAIMMAAAGAVAGWMLGRPVKN
ncbi:hypothetical protein [Daejeonella sp.]|uniref:hypothetical protein n=1 Tax=Daejeonella sp. TaxID=2805397 RepID=UPI0030C575E8